MAKRQFSAGERYAVYTVHGEKCYLCGEPLDLLTMEVDHIIPEALLDDSVKLRGILVDYGLPRNFELQSFANWMPACGPCNKRKRNMVFVPTPRIQLELQIAAEKAQRAKELAKSRIAAQVASKAWYRIKYAAEVSDLDESIIAEIIEFADFHRRNREPEVISEPMRLTPLIQVISENNGIRLIKGPYGVGGGPIQENVHSSFRCPTCSYIAWNGNRCVVCGEMDDD